MLFFGFFGGAWGGGDARIVPDIYDVPGREDVRSVTAASLAAAVRSAEKVPALYIPTDQLLTQLTLLAKPGDVLLMMGAGLDIRPIADGLVRTIIGKDGRANR